VTLDVSDDDDDDDEGDEEEGEDDEEGEDEGGAADESGSEDEGTTETEDSLVDYEAKKQSCITAIRTDLGGLVRSKGFFWVATQVGGLLLCGSLGGLGLVWGWWARCVCVCWWKQHAYY